MFVINYYLKGDPAWRWYYKYRIAPLPSDIYQYIENCEDINDKIKFNKSEPIKPLDQLMLILPPQMKHIIPTKYGNLMTDMDSNILDLYPIGFELDIYHGQKFIYSEPLLPEMDVDRVLDETKTVESSLTASEKKRNTISKKKKNDDNEGKQPTKIETKIEPNKTTKLAASILTPKISTTTASSKKTKSEARRNIPLHLQKLWMPENFASQGERF